MYLKIKKSRINPVWLTWFTGIKLICLLRIALSNLVNIRPQTLI